MRQRLGITGIFSCLVLVLALGQLEDTALAAKPAKVIAADPAAAEQETFNLPVRVLGSDFQPGDNARFLVSGSKSNQGGVTVLSTVFVKDTELLATIDIAPDATVGSFDIEIRSSSNGRRGKGIELFSVQAKGGSGGAGQCDLEDATPTEFELLGAERLRADVIREDSRFGGEVRGQQVFLTLAGRRLKDNVVDYAIVNPIVFAVSEKVDGVTGGPAVLKLYLLDSNRYGDTDSGVSRLLDSGGAEVTLPLAVRPDDVLFTNLDGDAFPDIISRSTFPSSVEIFRIDTSLEWTPQELLPRMTDAPTESVPNRVFGASLAVVDLGPNPDGVQDVIAVGDNGGGNGQNAVVGQVFFFDNDPGEDLAFARIDGSQVDLGTRDRFGGTVAFGNFDDSTGVDLLIAAPGVKVGKTQGAGAVYFFNNFDADVANNMVGFDPPVLARTGQSGGDQYGFQASAIPGELAGGVVISTQWQNNTARAEGFLPGSTTPDFTLVPNDETGGWATTGIQVVDVDEDVSPDFLIGVPNAECGNSAGSLGLVYLYLSSRTAFETDPIKFRPEELDPDWNAFGWSASAIPALDGMNNRHVFVLVGEPGRNVAGLDFVGQVHIYRFTGTP